MTFRGWKAEALEFFDGLEADNSKAYWQAHKTEYETLVRAPMEALLIELEPEWGEGRIFRPYRDVRFSKDKSPYKTSIAAELGGAYIQLTASGLAAGAGMWEMAPDQLERYREAVDDDRTGAKLEAIVATARKAGVEAQGAWRAEDGAERLPEGPPKDRAPSLQGPDRLAGVARGCVARDAAGQGPDRGLLPEGAAAERLAPHQRRPVRG